MKGTTAEKERALDRHEFDEVVQWLYRLRSRKYFGKITLTFRGDAITHVQQDHGIKPGEPLL